MKMRMSVWAMAMVLAMAMGGCSKKGDVSDAAGVKGGPAKEFNATVTMETPAGSFDGKIYVSGNKIRTELPQSVTISRLDKGVLWVLMPAQKIYIEQTLGPDHVVSFSETVPGEVKREKMSEETVGGRETDKYRVTYKVGEEEAQVYQWVDDDADMPVKMAGVDGGWAYEFKDIKPGAQVAELFEIPAGYNRMEMPSMPQGQ